MSNVDPTYDVVWSFYCCNSAEASKLANMCWRKWTETGSIGAASLTLGAEGPQMFDIATDISSSSSPTMPTIFKLTGWTHPFEMMPEILRIWVPQFMRECLETAQFVEAVCEYSCESVKLYGQISINKSGFRNSYLRQHDYPQRPAGMPDADWWMRLRDALEKNKTTVVVSCHGLGLIRDTIPVEKEKKAARAVVAPPNVDSAERSLQRIADALEKLVEKWGQAPALTVTKVETLDAMPQVGVVPCKSVTED